MHKNVICQLCPTNTKSAILGLKMHTYTKIPLLSAVRGFWPFLQSVVSQNRE